MSVFDERGGGRRKAIVYIGRRRFSSAKHLYAVRTGKGLG